MRSTNCMNRPELAPFTTPKSEGLLIFVLGAKKFALLNALNISQRNCSRARSAFKGKFLATTTFQVSVPGPVRMLRAELP